MQGLVTLDFGNSHPHAGLFSNAENEWKLNSVVPFSGLQEALKKFHLTPDNTNFVLSEVKNRDEELTPFMNQGYLLTRVKEYWRGRMFAGMPVNYAQSLGEDRLIEAYYLFKKFKTKTLIVDAGSFTTLDILTEEGFKGGYIIPGLKNYFGSFEAGELLKGVEREISLNLDLPHDTKTAMSASYQAFGALLHNLIDQYKIQKIFLTGGDVKYWEEILDDSRPSLEVTVEPHLIHHSLFHWFTTQIEPL
jgi:type III pantothenate kinase